ncbi:MAG: hypothetical protein SGBAC_009096 [Bacillariaceae sp.]
MPFVSRPSDASGTGVEVGIAVKLKFSLSNAFSAGEMEETTPEQTELDKAIEQVWNPQGENKMYEKNLLDEEEEDEEERNNDDDESTYYDTDDERDEASVVTAKRYVDMNIETKKSIQEDEKSPTNVHYDNQEYFRKALAHSGKESVIAAEDYRDEEISEADSSEEDDDRTERTGEVIMNDNDDASCYAIMSTHDETEIKLEEIRSADMEQAEAYLDSVLPPSSSEDDDANKEEKRSSGTIARFDNQDYVLAVLSHAGKEHKTNEDLDKTVDVVEDNPYEEPTAIDREADESNEMNQVVLASEDTWSKDFSQLLLIKGLFSTKRNEKDVILGASDAMARQIKDLVSPLIDPSYDSRRFYMDDDLSSSSELSECLSLDKDDEHHNVVGSKSMPERPSNETTRKETWHTIEYRSSISGRGVPHERRSERDEDVHNLQTTLSLDSVLPERIVKPAERKISNFFKTHFGVDLYDDGVDNREYKDFVSTYFMDNRLLDYERMSRLHTPSSKIRSKSTDGQGRRRNSQQKSTRRKPPKKYRHRTMEV